MIRYLTMDQMIEVLEHNKDNARDTDIWILHENGTAEIVPDCNISELQNPRTWPRYICRAAAVNEHVTADTEAAADPASPGGAIDGMYAALDHINWAIGVTIAFGQPVQTVKAHAAAITGRFRNKLKRQPAQEKS